MIAGEPAAAGDPPERALDEARRTIVAMPVRYTTLPNSETPVFAATGRAVRLQAPLTFAADTLRSAGALLVPGPLWRTLQRLGSWIEPVLIAEWARLMRVYGERMGVPIEAGAAEARLAWLEPSRDTALARMAAGRLMAAGEPVTCVWSGPVLQAGQIDIDHALPWSA